MFLVFSGYVTLCACLWLHSPCSPRCQGSSCCHPVAQPLEAPPWTMGTPELSSVCHGRFRFPYFDEFIIPWACHGQSVIAIVVVKNSFSNNSSTSIWDTGRIEHSRSSRTWTWGNYSQLQPPEALTRWHWTVAIWMISTAMVLSNPHLCRP